MSAKHPPQAGHSLPMYSKDGDMHGGSWVMGIPMSPPSHPENQKAATWVPVDYSQVSSFAFYNHGYSNHPVPSAIVAQNPYLHFSPVSGSSDKRAMETIGKMLDRCGKKLEDNTRKASELAGNVWNHFKTGSSISDVTMAKLAHGTKVLANGGSDKMFQQTFGICAGERLQKAYACYLSTSTGPVIGTLYLSSLRLAFCSDNPLFFHSPSGQQEWIYYKVIIQLNQLAGVNPSSNSKNPAEKYIQIVTSGNHEFWFMGFVSYNKALKNLRDALQHREIKYMH